MRQFSQNFLNQLYSKRGKFFLLVQLEFNTQFFYTSLPYDVTFIGSTFYSDNGLLEFDSPRNTTIVDREIYKLAFIDHADEFQTEFRNNLVGNPIYIYLGITDDFGTPYLDPEDVITIYGGEVDGGYIVVDNGVKKAIIECSSPMGKLDARGGYSVSRQGMDQVSLTDTSFDKVYEGSKEIELGWGKI